MFSVSSHQMKAVRTVVATVVVACCLLAVGGNAFVVVPMARGGSSISTSTSTTTATQLLGSSSAEEGSASSSSTSTVEDNKSNDDDNWYSSWSIQDSGITINEKLFLRNTKDEERGKGGMHANQKIKALEVIATIPRSLIISSVDAPVRAIEAASNANVLSWVTDITAATIVALHPSIDDFDEDDDVESNLATTKSNKIDFIQSWIHGGWATQGEDLGPPESNFGPKHVTGSLMSTGSDNDHNIYAKFRMPCHPVIHRASLGLIVLTGCTEEQARDQLSLRGSTYRSLRDALEPLILESSPREKGSKRERRCWDVADLLSKVLSRVTTIQLDNENEKASYAIVPIHERLEHSLNENTKLITSGNDILLIATRDINVGEAITRDYTISPKLISNNDNTNDDNNKNEDVVDDIDIDIDDGSALRLLLQFGLPPNAWPEEELTVDK